MVNGLDIFRSYFYEFPNDYVLIGGVACELALGTLRLDFRPTGDFDIVVVSKRLDQGFGAKLKQFINDGEYIVKNRKSNNNPTFFCFLNPKNNTFPAKLELATVIPSSDWKWDFAPLDIGDNRPSLSAILFEPDFYQFILENHVVSNDISYMRLEGLIPLKCCALLDLSQKVDPSQKDLTNIEKHRQDVFRLANALPSGYFSLPEKVASVTMKALNQMAKTPLVESEAELLTMLRQFYRLS